MLTVEDHQTTRCAGRLAREIESVRMLFWWLSMQRGMGHRAHEILIAGFSAVEALRAIGFEFWRADNAAMVSWRFASGKWVEALTSLRADWVKHGVSEALRARLDRHREVVEKTLTLDHVAIRRNVQGQAIDQKGDACGAGQANGAAVQDVTSESTSPCPSAGPVGKPLTTTPSEPSPSSTQSGVKGSTPPTPPQQSSVKPSPPRRGRKDRRGPYSGSVGQKINEAIRRGDAEPKEPTQPIPPPSGPEVSER